MPKPRLRITVLLLSSSLAILSSACSRPLSTTLQQMLNRGAIETKTPATDIADSIVPAATANMAAPAPVATPAPPTPTASPVDSYPLAIAKATNAITASQAAQSQDDWRLVANRWQQAIELLTAVPKSNQHYAMAQRKITEYRQNLALAQQKASRANPEVNSSSVVVIQRQNAQSEKPNTMSGQAAPSRPGTIAAIPLPPQLKTAPQITTPSRTTTPEKQVYSAPIIRRAGGTPVIRVMFNGGRPFDMIVDTGASGTLITQQMATALGIVPVAKMNVDTASAQNVAFPLGYVDSVEVNGIFARNLLVAIGSSGIDTGLLGHDFFGSFDVTIRENSVEFRER